MRESNPEPDRYARQRLLPQIGSVGQRKLSAARVLLVGCGALGSQVAEILVRSGVGNLRIVDRDLVEWSNLQRQVLFDERDAREETPKAIAAGRRLREINSAVSVQPMVCDANAGNIGELAEGMSLIVDGTDNVATRYMLNDYSVKHGIPWVYGGCVGVTGRVMGFYPGVTGCLRCVFPEPPNAANLPTCDTAGVLGPAAAMVGAMQVSTAMRIIVDGESAAQNSRGLLILDAWDGEFRYLPSAAKPQADCPCCGRREFPYLSTAGEDFTTTLCGRNAVQVVRPRDFGTLDLSEIVRRFASVGSVSQTPYFVRCHLREPDGVELTAFPDGRLLVRGMTDSIRAKSLYARFIGS
jgi:molybdopterin-synthase adenylyltransferase